MVLDAAEDCVISSVYQKIKWKKKKEQWANVITKYFNDSELGHLATNSQRGRLGNLVFKTGSHLLS